MLADLLRGPRDRGGGQHGQDPSRQVHPAKPGPHPSSLYLCNLYQVRITSKTNWTAAKLGQIRGSDITKSIAQTRVQS